MQLCCLVEDSAAKLNQIRIFFFSEMLNRFSFEVKLGRSSVLPYIVFLLAVQNSSIGDLVTDSVTH